jgi:hypothetical protein
MKSSVFLRVASLLTLLHAVLHTIGGVFGSPSPGIAAATFATMQANRFPVLGVTRSYWDFYRGLGLGITISLTAEGLLFWVLASLFRRDAERLRPILIIFMASYLVFALNSYAYFFYAPVVVETLIAASLGMAIVTAKPSRSTP